HAAVTAGGGVDAVNDFGGDIHSRVETEGDIGTVNVVVNGLGQADDVQTFLAQQVSGFVGPVAAQTKQAIQLGGAVVLLHGGNFVDLVILNHAHLFEGGTLGAQDGAADSQDAGNLIPGHFTVIAVDQAVIAVQ